MKIAVIGTGYVGLVTGVCFAESGNDVTCVDIDEKKISKLKNGELPIYEPDLDTYFKRSVDEGRLRFTTSLNDGIGTTEVIFLALPTPPGEDGSADLSYILGVAEDIGSSLDHYVVVVNKSTVPVGTAEEVRSRIQKNAKVEFDVVSNPEFLREGLAVSDFMKPDRVVIGSSSKKASRLMKELYVPFVKEGNPILFMDERSAEMTKYAANAFLAMKISFMNEIANLSEKVGANVDHIRLGIGTDERIGRRFLFSGIGYGGSCFPKDVMALYRTSEDHDYEFKILKAVTDVNKFQKKILFNKLSEYFGNDLKGRSFALWGLAFKPDTDDIREAPALELIDLLLRAGASIQAFDPEAAKNVEKIHANDTNFKIVDHQYEALKNADALLIATEWDLFKSPDFEVMSREMKSKVIFDGRNLYELSEMKEQGFHYESIGRTVVN